MKESAAVGARVPRTSPSIFLLALVLPAWIGSSLFAENEIRMGYAEGSPGENEVEVIVTAINDVPIHGYSLAFTYPADVLTLVSVSTAGTHVQSLEPDFVAPNLDNSLGVGNLGVIFSFSEPVSLKELPPLPEGSYPRVVARLTFDVADDAPGGLYPLRLVDGVGNPANFNRFSDRGTSIVPNLIHGEFKVEGGNTLMIDKKQVFAGLAQTAILQAYVQHSDPLAGFQIGFTFDKRALTLEDITYNGTVLGIELGNPGLIEAFSWDVDTNYSATHARASIGSLFDFRQPIDGQELRPCVGSLDCQSLVKMTFKVAKTASDIGQFLDLTLQDTGKPGDLDNRLIVKAESLDPDLIHGKIYFSTGDLTGLVVDSLNGLPVSGVTVTSEPDGIVATTGLDGRFRLAGLPAGRYSLLLKRSGYYWNRHTMGPDGEESILVEGNGATTEIGNVPLYRILPTHGGLFLRGRINDDSRIDLSDGVFLLNYLFQGQEGPGCEIAADLNDDDRVDISDAIYLLNHLFLGGEPPLPPYSENGRGCGVDPTPGGRLTCQRFTCL